jgi:hypothetical protein
MISWAGGHANVAVSELIFWASMALLTYVYLGYPALLAIIAPFYRRSKKQPGYCPRISVLIAAYNEEAHIGQKVAETLALEYPPEKMEIVVVHLGNPETLARFFRRERWHGKHVIRVFLRSLTKLPNLNAVSFALYTLLCLTGLAVGAIQLVLGASPVLLAYSAAALLAAPVLLSLRSTISSKCWSEFVPLAVLFLTYGIARATCLLYPGSGSPRKTIGGTLEA